jgi:hypothetical protein
MRALSFVVWTMDGSSRIERYECDIRHIVEQAPAAREGHAHEDIDGPDNLVRIPTLKHWEITGWYMRGNERYGGLSPREYLRGKGWDERRSIGLYALERFGVLSP